MGAKEIAVDSRRERKKEETRQVIVRAAMDLFDAQGFASTTMEQIAACADVAKGTLYNYFPVKEAIVATFMRYSAREAAPELAALLAAPVDTRARLKAVFHKVAQWQQPHRELLEPYISYRMGQMLESLRHPELRSGFGHNLAAVLEKGREGGEIRGDLPLPTLTAALETAYLTVILNWLVDEGSELVPALERMIDLFLDGAAAPGEAMSTAEVRLVDWQGAYHAGAALAGGKGWNLAQLKRYGFKVPDSLVLLAPAYREFMLANDLPMLIDDGTQAQQLQQSILAANFPILLKEEIRAGLVRADWLDRPLAVRSSALGEDSTDASFAGIHTSFLNVCGPAAVAEAIKGCYASLWSERALAYRQRFGLNLDPPEIAVVIMPLLEAESSGIAFSCDPVSGRKDQMLIAANFGLGEAVVADATEADSYRIGWTPILQHPQLIDLTCGAKRMCTRPAPEGGTRTMEVESGRDRQVLNDEQIRDLARLVRRVHLALGEGEIHQDIEWVFVADEFHLVQARPITALPCRSYPQLAQQPELWSNGNLRDALPMVQTPLNWSRCQPLIEYLFYAQYRAVGFRVDPSVPRLRLIDGRAYFNLATLQWECYDAYGLQPEHYNFFLGGHQPQIELPGKPSLTTRLLRLRRSLRMARKQKRFSRQAGAIFARAVARTDALRAVDLAACSDIELAGMIDRQGELFRESPEILQLLAGGGAVFATLTPLLERYLPGRGLALTSALLAGCDGITSADHGVRLAELAQRIDKDPAAQIYFAAEPFEVAEWKKLPADSIFLQGFTEFLAEYGHRCVYELDYRIPRWSEDPSYLLETIRGLRGVSTMEIRARQQRAAAAAWAEVKSRVPRMLWPLVRRWVAAGGRDGGNREMAKSILVRMGDIPRRAVLEIGRRLVERKVLGEVDDIFFLYWPETLDLLAGRMDGTGLKPLIADRRLRHIEFEACAAPDLVVGAQPRSTPTLASGSAAGSELRGIAVAAGCFSGVARLIRHPSEGGRLAAGEILVAPSTDPAWTPLFLKAAALVTETGGILSHGAIVAREYGIPAVLNVQGALTHIADGQRIRVDGDHGIIEHVQG